MNGEIQKSFSLLLYSFRLHTDWRQLLNSLVCEASIWQKSRVGINEQFLFSHVEDYYNRNSKISTPELANIDTSQCVFFELKDSLKNSRAQCSFEKLFNLSLVLEAKEKSFSFLSRNNSASIF